MPAGGGVSPHPGGGRPRGAGLGSSGLDRGATGDQVFRVGQAPGGEGLEGVLAGGGSGGGQVGGGAGEAGEGAGWVMPSAVT